MKAYLAFFAGAVLASAISFSLARIYFVPSAHPPASAKTAENIAWAALGVTPASKIAPAPARVSPQAAASEKSAAPVKETAEPNVASKAADTPAPAEIKPSVPDVSPKPSVTAEALPAPNGIASFLGAPPIPKMAPRAANEGAAPNTQVAVLPNAPTTPPANLPAAKLAPPSAPTAAPAPAQPQYSWRITKTEWTAADEKGFGEFVRAIALSGCTNTIECMHGPSNPYHGSDAPGFDFHADCAKWVYMLRAYYASKNGLPFSYVDKIVGEGGDLRFTTASNHTISRHDLVDTGNGISPEANLKKIHDSVWTATYRMNPGEEDAVLADFYSPKLQPGSIHAGTAIYDINGHVVLVYDVTPDGSILYMDAYPDEHVSRGFYGPHLTPSPQDLGGGFKNFRPLKLVGATRREDGTYVGGHIVLASNEEIPDFSLEQYRGQFAYAGEPLDLFAYVRAKMSNGRIASAADAQTAMMKDLMASGQVRVYQFTESADSSLQ